MKVQDSHKSQLAVVTDSPSHCPRGSGPCPSRPGGHRCPEAEPVSCPGHAAAMTGDKDARPTNVPVYLALCMFSLSSSLPTRSIWIQLPVLTHEVPEGTSLSYYLLVVLECANLATVAYLVTRKLSRGRLSEVPFVYCACGLGLVSLVLLGAFWNHTSQIDGVAHSFALMLFAFLAAIISSVSIVTYIPFGCRLRENYITGILLGDGLGSLVPHLLACAQGIGRQGGCAPPPNVTVSNTSRYRGGGHHSINEYHMRTTLPPVLLPPKIRFDPGVFFFLCAGLVFISGLCFLALRWGRLCAPEYTEQLIDNMDEVDMASAAAAAHCEEMDVDDDVWQTQCDGRFMLDDGSIRQVAFHPDASNLDHHPHNLPSHSNHPCPPEVAVHKSPAAQPNSPLRINQRRSRESRPSQLSRMTSTGSTATTKYSESVILEARPQTYPLLIVITFWTTCVLTGPLSPNKAYACYPTGNTTFFVGAILTDIIVVLSCLAAARCRSSRSQVTIIIALTCLGTILLTYFVALLTFSHHSESRGDSPLFGYAGELLAAAGWVAITGLFSFARVSIGNACRDYNATAMLHYSCALALGTFVGSLSIGGYVSICKIFRPYGRACS